MIKCEKVIWALEGDAPSPGLRDPHWIQRWRDATTETTDPPSGGEWEPKLIGSAVDPGMEQFRHQPV